MTAPDNREPLPCPFCGPGNSIVEAYYDDWSKRYRVGCGRCGASSGISPRASDDSATVAIARWNTRDGWNARAALDARPDPELQAAEAVRRAASTHSGGTPATEGDQEMAHQCIINANKKYRDDQSPRLIGDFLSDEIAEAIAAARAQGHAAGVREERERCLTALPDNYQFSSYPDLQNASKAAVARYRDAIRALAAQEPLPANDGWLSVNVELPPIGQPVLIHRPGNDRKPVCEAVRLTPHQGVEPWYWATPITASGDCDEILPEHVTKWRPLPAPPDDGGRG